MRMMTVQLRRLKRARAMGYARAWERIKWHLRNMLSPSLALRRFAFRVDRVSIKPFDVVYAERPEAGATNIAEKFARVALGGPFEPYDVTLVNRAAVQLIGTATRICEIGSGTGIFASAASADPRVSIVASEFDDGARTWAQDNRDAPNISFGKWTMEQLRREPYDLAVAIEVIEHIKDFGGFLVQLSSLAPAAIITTPNKNGSALGSVAATPEYSDHVREWTAGEFFWVLRAFYEDVDLYTIPRLAHQMAMLKADSSYSPTIEKCGPLSRSPSLLAYCSRPRRFH